MMAPEGSEGTGSPSGEGGQATQAAGGGDTVAGGGGADTVQGGGNDTVQSGGADTLSGGQANDQIADPAQAARDAARAAKPDKADGYALNLSDKAKGQLGDLTDDPAVKAVREHALAKGWTQGDFDDRIVETLEVLADKGLLAPSFDPAAELAKLGEGGKAKQEDLEVFGKNLLDRKDITAEEYEEYMSLVPTAAGTTLLGKLRALMGDRGKIVIAGTAAETPDARKARAAEMRRDPRYDSDPAWRKQTDELRMSAYGKS